MDWLKPRLKSLGRTGAAFARALDIPKSRVYEMQNGTRRLQPQEIAPAARFLEISEPELLALLDGRTISAIEMQTIRGNVETIGTPTRETQFQNIPNLALYRSSPAERGAEGIWMLYDERAGEVERPEFLKFSKSAFAVRVLDNDNMPVYRKRDVLLVDPDSPAIEGDDCIFTGQLPAEAVAGELVRETPSLWIVHQYAIKGERELPKSAFPYAWPIVSRQHRR